MIDGIIILIMIGLLMGIVEVIWDYIKTPTRKKRRSFNEKTLQQILDPKLTDQFCSRAMKADHLKSSYWHTLKMRRLKIANHKCEICGSDSKLHLHHTTYENLLKESIGDVVILCAKCHQKQHDKYGYKRETIYLPLVTKN